METTEMETILSQTKGNYTALMEMGDNLVDAKGVYAIYQSPSGDAPNVVALRGVNIEIGRGEFVAAVGPSGSGKSSLMRCIGGLQTPSAGTVKYGQLDITKLDEADLVGIRRNTVGFVFQSPTLIPYLSAEKNVIQTLKYSGNTLTAAKARTDELMQLLGIAHRSHALPSKLSGGERQRVGIAVALANSPRLILADEPTGNLDHDNTANVMGLFRDLHKELDTSFFVVTHSQYVSSFADRNLELRDGIFLGQHAAGIDLDSLEGSRQIIISKGGQLNLPPEMLGLIEEYGSLWDVRLHQTDDGPEIHLKPPKDEFKQNGNGGLSKCPVCKNDVTPKDATCSKCGAQLIK